MVKGQNIWNNVDIEWTEVAISNFKYMIYINIYVNVYTYFIRVIWKIILEQVTLIMIKYFRYVIYVISSLKMIPKSLFTRNYYIRNHISDQLNFIY